MTAGPPRRAVVRCPLCTSLNAVNLARLADGPRCGECKRPILLDRPIAAHDDDLQRTLDGTTVPVVVDFYADWCGPCKVMAPVFDDLAGRRAGELLFLKVDSDRSPAATQRYGVRAIPTLVIFRGGREVARQTGAVPLRALEELIARSALT